MAQEQITKPLSGWWVFAAFAAFFGLIIIVNTIFITTALKSHSGLVTEDAYKKGVSYNKTLEEARNQPEWLSEVTFQDGLLSWTLNDTDGKAIEGANVQAAFFRPIKDGDDFAAALRDNENGLYSLVPEFPKKGSWTVNLSATWNNKTFKTSKNLIVR